MSEIVTETEPEKLYEVGANFAADAVIIRDGKVCLIARSDGGGWALPGGFRNIDESSAMGACREAYEETGLYVSDGQLVFSGRVDDPRNSDSRWIESDAYLFVTDENSLQAGDDAADAEWFDLDSLPELYGSHQTMIENAIRVLMLNSTLESATPTETKGGHMGYTYKLFALNDHYLFIKQFSPSNFSRPEKEQHSLFYLQKEALVLDHLKNQGYEHIPLHHELIANSTLLLDGMSEQSGWSWRCPTSKNEQRQYIDDVLSSLSELEVTRSLELYEPIRPPHQSFYEEGWGAMTPETLIMIADKIRSYAPRLKVTPEYIEHAITELPNIAHSITEAQPTSIFNHHDIRQNNIAWHPELGVRIVDWSWYGPGVAKADTTTFLIDCKKSGIDVSLYLDDYFNKDHARTLIGFWLHHSLWPTRTDNDNVRLHQVASALAALELLEMSDEVSSL